MKPLAIFDLGSARTKLAIVSVVPSSGQISIQHFKEETSFASPHQNERDNPELHHNVLEALSKMRSIAFANGCNEAIVIGTESFRQSRIPDYFLKEIEKLIGSINIITSELEGKIFFSYISSMLRGQFDKFVLADVGGGSVQIVWADEVISLPIGTFELERMFQQGKNLLLEPNTADAIMAYVNDRLKNSISHPPHVQILVLGSNCMESFFRACLLNLRVPYQDNQEILSVQPDILRLILKNIINKPYEELEYLYPVNRKFMHGADTMLIIALAVADYFGIKKVVPTDESVSTSIATMAIKFPEVLRRHGLFPKSLT
jgi:exopolyphosphatase/pppGpp-phosphohydrolase